MCCKKVLALVLHIWVWRFSGSTDSQWPRAADTVKAETNTAKAGKEEDAMQWAERVSKGDAADREHRTLQAEDLSYDFLSKMGFVPPPPPPPWGFNKVGGSTSEIEERVMRQLIPISDLPKVMLCDACGAVAYQISLKLKVAQQRAKKGQFLSELIVFDSFENVCAGAFASDPEAGEPGPKNWDEYGVADLNASCASPPEVSCWNSTKRLVGPGCAKTYEWQREKELRFGWLGTRIRPECERLVANFADGDGEYALYKFARKHSFNATLLSQQLCKNDCDTAAKEQVREAQRKYVDEYNDYSKRIQWNEDLGYENKAPPTAEEVEELQRKAKSRQKKSKKGKLHKKKKKKKKKTEKEKRKN